jgi:UDP-N-acetylglucosamine acyltransferase
MTVTTIHKTAVIADGAQIHDTAEIGPYVVIGPHVRIGAGTKIGAHSVIDGHTTIGESCKIFPGVSIGLEPQDLKYKDEPTGVVIGNNVTLREYVTIHRATGDRTTVIGNDCFLMNYVHIAHDCRLGNGVIIANATTVAGHVTIGENAVISGTCVFHQNVRVGKAVMMGGLTGTRVDLPPFTMCDGRPAYVRGINVIGLRRQKIGPETRGHIKQAYKLLYREGLNFGQALERIEAELPQSPEIMEICEFFRTSKRGIAAAFGDSHEAGRYDDNPVDDI